MIPNTLNVTVQQIGYTYLAIHFLYAIILNIMYQVRVKRVIKDLRRPGLEINFVKSLGRFIFLFLFGLEFQFLKRIVWVIAAMAIVIITGEFKSPFSLKMLPPEYFIDEWRFSRH